MAKVIGYARVSSHSQSLSRQLESLSKYVESEMIVTDKASGANLERPGYQSLKHGIGKLIKGDTLYIKSLDRLSRNKEEVKQEIEYFKEHGINLKIIDVPTTLCDYPEGQEWIKDMVTNILIEVLASIAENERTMIKQRQREGYESMTINEQGKRISQRTGKPVGRPKIEYPENWKEIYGIWKDGKITARKAMEFLSLKPNSFYKLVKLYTESEG